MPGLSKREIARKAKGVASHEAICLWIKACCVVRHEPAGPVVTPAIARAAKKQDCDPDELAASLHEPPTMTTKKLAFCKKLKIKPDNFAQGLCDLLND